MEHDKGLMANAAMAVVYSFHMSSEEKDKPSGAGQMFGAELVSRKQMAAVEAVDDMAQVGRT